MFSFLSQISGLYVTYRLEYGRLMFWGEGDQMLKWILRLLLVVYFLMPIAAIGLFAQTFVQFRSDAAPVYEAASASITSATNTLNRELSNLGANFAPLANAVNGVRDTIYTLIDVVNGINLAFIDNISSQLNTISTQVNSVVTTTTSALTGYMTLIGLAAAVFIAWIVLTYILFFVLLFTGLWRKA